MNQIKLTALLFVFFLIPINVSAVEINECEDEEGNRSFQKKCPVGTTSVNKKKLFIKGNQSNLSPKRASTYSFIFAARLWFL